MNIRFEDCKAYNAETGKHVDVVIRDGQHYVKVPGHCCYCDGWEDGRHDVCKYHDTCTARLTGRLEKAFIA